MMALTKKLTIQQRKDIAKTNGLKCLPKQFISEKICRKYFEEIFLEKFNKVRPHWLKGSKGNNLELDGYNQKLKLAFEYQGEQHYKTMKHYGRTLSEQKKEDAIKRRICFEKGICLIEVPFDVGYENMGTFIIEQAEVAGYEIKQHAEDIDYHNFDVYSSEILCRLKDLAIEKGGKLLSEIYINNRINMKWQCKKRHTFFAKANNVQDSGTWCPYCSGRNNNNLELMKEIAKKRKGKCLSEKYINNNMKLRWQCEKMHQWEATPRDIKNLNHWCPYCAGRMRLTIKDMQIIAKKRNGKCISKDYKNAHTKLIWECEKMHQWEATYANIYQGNWCPYCSGKKKV